MENSSKYLNEQDIMKIIPHLMLNKQMGIWRMEFSPKGDTFKYNAECYEILGYKDENMRCTWEDWLDIVYDEDKKIPTTAIEQCRLGIIDKYDIEYRIVKADGHILWIQSTGVVFERGEDGNVKSVVGQWEDVTSVKIYKSALAKDYAAKIDNDVIAEVERVKDINNIIFDESERPVMAFSSEGEMIHCNKETLRFFGFTKRPISLDSVTEMLESSMYDVKSGGIEYVSLSECLENAKGGMYECEIYLKRSHHEKLMPFQCVFKKMPYNMSEITVLFMRSIVAMKEIRETLQAQDVLLSIINYIASLLMSAKYDDFEVILEECFMMLGMNAGLDRIFVWQNVGDEEQVCPLEIYQWTLDGGIINKDDDKPDIENLQPYYKDWTDTFVIDEKGVLVKISELSPEEENLLMPNGNGSIFMVPIAFNHEFWGVLGLEDYFNERSFSDIDEHIFQSAGILFASAVLRNELTKELIVVREEALAGSKAKSAFLANMSHEIRTPMNVIIGMTTIANRTDEVGRLKECISKIGVSCKHLLGLINDILDMSKLESGKLEIAPGHIHLSDTISNIRTIATPLLEAKNQHLNVTIGENVPDSIYCDEMRLSQVIVNLLSNATKFSAQGETVDVSIYYISETEDDVTLGFKVSDKGIGISKEQQEKLFQAFVQAETGTAGKFGGTGLGLAICKMIVELMHGEIHIESEPGKGSDFIFSICAGKEKQSECAHDADDENTVISYDFAGKTLLLAEDIEINREIIQLLLEDTGITIESAENGRIAADMFEKDPEKYDIILMDVQMPEMNGLEATQCIRAMAKDGLERASEVPIIAMTANAFSEDVANCIEVGMDDHLSKPVEIDMMLKKINKYLKKGTNSHE